MVNFDFLELSRVKKATQRTRSEEPFPGDLCERKKKLFVRNFVQRLNFRRNLDNEFLFISSVFLQAT